MSPTSRSSLSAKGGTGVGFMGAAIGIVLALLVGGILCLIFEWMED